MTDEIRIRAAGILIQDNRILLVQHEKKGKKYWLAPGGGVDYGEKVDAAVRREFKEELNIEVETDDILWVADSIHPEGKRHILNIFIGCRFISGEYSLGNDKRLNSFDFFSADDLDKIVIFPAPLKNELKKIISGGKGTAIYLNSEWV